MIKLNNDEFKQDIPSDVDDIHIISIGFSQQPNRTTDIVFRINSEDITTVNTPFGSEKQEVIKMISGLK